MKRLRAFLREYKLFVLAALAAVVGLVFYLLGHHTITKWILDITAIFETLPLLWGMYQDVRSGKYGIDLLAATAIVTSVVLGQYWAAIVIVLMLTGGESLENYAEHRARTELNALITRAPVTAHVIHKGKTEDVAVKELKIGEKITIKAGELVPTDAVILEGSASFDESSLTGESTPQLKEIGDVLLSGSINLDGAIVAKVTASAADSQYQQIIKLVRSAASSQAPFVRLADRYSVPFTFTAFAIAIAVWVTSGHAIRFLEVIVVATPCPLLLAAPIALISGMARASRYGIIVKTGSAFEKLAEAETFAFDKTGTLTRGELQVSDIKVFGDYTQEEVLKLAGSLEQSSNHILAHAIVAQALEAGIKLDKAKHVQESSGRGVAAMLKGKRVLVGRFAFVQDEGIELPKKFSAQSINQTAAYVAVDNKLAGVIMLADSLRPETKATLARLRKLGVKHLMMITGDNAATAKMIAKKLHIDDVYAEMLPADKLQILASVKHRPVAFVGDGVNDAPILTGSDIGIALGARGSTAASESADLVIMQDDLSRVALAYRIAKRTFSIAQQSILVGIGLSLILMLIFATGKLSPLTGAILQEVVDIFVIFNALRAHLGSH